MKELKNLFSVFAQHSKVEVKCLLSAILFNMIVMFFPVEF